MQQQAIAGIDKINISFPNNSSYVSFLQDACSNLFNNLRTSDFVRVDNTVKGQKKVHKIQWYQQSQYLKSEDGATLIAVHTKPISYLGGRNLVQINGLAFSQSALNPLRPFDLNQLIAGTQKLDGRITSLDVYLDSFTDLVPFDEILRQSLPANYRRYVRSPFVKNAKGRPVVPRIMENGVYYGGKSGCQLLAYNKRLAPGQRVAEGDNLLKFPWYRLELRLRNALAKKVGGNLFESLYQGGYLSCEIVEIFDKYFSFIEPIYSRPSLNPEQTWFKELKYQAMTPLY